jgi:hypothetical protein
VLGRLPILDTNQHHAKRGSDCAGKLSLVPAFVTTLIPPLIHPIAEKGILGILVNRGGYSRPAASHQNGCYTYDERILYYHASLNESWHRHPPFDPRTEAVFLAGKGRRKDIANGCRDAERISVA